MRTDYGSVFSVASLPPPPLLKSALIKNPERRLVRVMVSSRLVVAEEALFLLCFLHLSEGEVSVLSPSLVWSPQTAPH